MSNREGQLDGLEIWCRPLCPILQICDKSEVVYSDDVWDPRRWWKLVMSMRCQREPKTQKKKEKKEEQTRATDSGLHLHKQSNSGQWWHLGVTGEGGVGFADRADASSSGRLKIATCRLVKWTTPSPSKNWPHIVHARTRYSRRRSTKGYLSSKMVDGRDGQTVKHALHSDDEHTKFNLCTLQVGNF